MIKHHTLHEIAKFGAGLVAGDFLAGVWLWSNDMFPISFLGIEMTSDMLLPWLVFDAALFIILVHYGWHYGKTPRLTERTYLLVAGVIFGVVAFAHLAHIFLGSDVVLLGWTVPIWISWIGTAIATYLSYMSITLALKMKR